MAEAPLFKRAALIGIGLIGASMALAMRRSGLAGEIVCAARSEKTRETALRLGLADAAFASPRDAVKGADLVVLATPIGAFAQIAEEIGPVLEAGTVVTDVGSVKGMVFRDVAPHLPLNVHLVPGHPVAGTEHSGPEAGFAELFENRWCILTPAEDADQAAVDRISALWTAMGAKVELMSAQHHDLVLAITSHVPHLIAYNIVGTASDLETVTQSEVIKYSAGGFRDFTRIAASDPTMWRDVFLNNRDAVIEMLGRFVEDLIALQRAIRWGEGDTLFDLFTKTRAIRRSIIDAGQETQATDFGRRAKGSAE
ncbi:prephenate/arogenate dehydrogenase family protein [Zavarzinia sp.]|uniref:prephenate/arogenate dehydrogenase family protein n=1 Tax=Zavarzinia sp. TaxID=2027920 RepID=UPI003562F8C8